MSKKPLKYFSFKRASCKSIVEKALAVIPAKAGIQKPLVLKSTGFPIKTSEMTNIDFCKNLNSLTVYWLLFTVFFLTACAPKFAPPPLYIEQELSLDEVVKKAGGDIDVLKAIADIRIEKNSELYDVVNASALVKRPDWIHMRIYKFGMLVKDFVIKDNELYALTGSADAKLKNIAGEFLHSVFWWEGLSSGSMHREGDEYVIRTENKTIHLDHATLLPLFQEITLQEKVIRIKYSEPQNNEGFWYQSKLLILVDAFSFDVTLVKLIKNPALGENDFRTP